MLHRHIMSLWDQGACFRVGIRSATTPKQRIKEINKDSCAASEGSGLK